MLRADMDALSVQEQTGLDYASTAEGVMHACGHDMHVAWLVGATAQLSAARDDWHGTVMAVFQPAEETAAGAQAMIDDGLFDRFPKPDVILGQHVMPTPAGSIGTRSGVITSAADSFEIRMFGRGAHGSMPEASIDPVVMAAATVLRLQTIVSPADRLQAQVRQRRDRWGTQQRVAQLEQRIGAAGEGGVQLGSERVELREGEG
jgi:hippurate hydrolase